MCYTSLKNIKEANEIAVAYDEAFQFRDWQTVELLEEDYRRANRMLKEENFIARVREERKLQNRLWGTPQQLQQHPMEWCSTLVEFIGRYASIANEWPHGGGEEEMELALVKLAAAAMGAYEIV